MTSRQFFNLWYRLDSEDRQLIWFTDDEDGVLVDSEAHIPSFGKLEALTAYAQNRSLTVDVKEGVLFDLDATSRWLEAPDALSIDCVNTLNAWNLFADVARSVGGLFDVEPKETIHIYQKLFWGNNLACVTPPGEHYDPSWTPSELETLAEVLKSGLSLFRDSVRCV